MCHLIFSRHFHKSYDQPLDLGFNAIKMLLGKDLAGTWQEPCVRPVLLQDYSGNKNKPGLFSLFAFFMKQHPNQ